MFRSRLFEIISIKNFLASNEIKIFCIEYFCSFEFFLCLLDYLNVLPKKIVYINYYA